MIHVVCGPMFSGKSGELQRLMRWASLRKKKCIALKHGVDNRYDPSKIVTHDQHGVDCYQISKISSCELDLEAFTAIFVDEFQFFREEDADALQGLSWAGKDIYIAGLDMDFRGRAFGPMGTILAFADVVDKRKAVCTVCGQEAGYSFRKVDCKDQTMVGGYEAYEPRCIGHFRPF